MTTCQSSDVMLEVALSAFVRKTLAIDTGLQRSGVSYCVARHHCWSKFSAVEFSWCASSAKQSDTYEIVRPGNLIWWHVSRVYDNMQRSITVRVGSVTSKMRPVCAFLVVC